MQKVSNENRGLEVQEQRVFAGILRDTVASKTAHNPLDVQHQPVKT